MTAATISSPPRWRRWLFRVLWAAWILLWILRNGIDAFLIVSVTWFAAMYALFYYAETRLSRTMRLYVWFAQGAATLGLLLFSIPLGEHADPTLAALGWGGITLLGLIWTVYYERSEAR